MADNHISDSILEAAKEHSLHSAKRLLAIIDRYRKPVFGKETTTRTKTSSKKKSRSFFISFLSVVPFLLVALFITSFFWDFNGLEAHFFHQQFYFEGLLRILSVSGLIGFLTNWVAITMLFKPARKRPLLGQGLIPAQKNRIAARLSQTVAEDLINPEIIKRRIHKSGLIRIYRKRSTAYIKNVIDDPAFRDELKQLIMQYVEDIMGDPDIRGALAERILVQLEQSLERNSIEQVALKAYTFIKGQKMQQIVEESLNRIPDSIEKSLEKFDLFLDDLPRRIEANSDAIEHWLTSALYKLVNQLDVQALVEDNLRAYDEQKLSDVIFKATNEQLRYIQYLGGILGIIGGFVIWEPLYSLGFLCIIAIIIFLLDNLLLKLG